MSISKRRSLVAFLAYTALFSLKAKEAPATSSLIVPYPAGGVMDAVGRLLVPHIQQAFKHQVIVENVPGAGGLIGLRQLVEPSGAGLVALGTDSDSILVPLATESARDLTGRLRLTAVVGSGPMVLVAGADPKKVSDALHARPPAVQIACGNFGVFSNSHLLALELQRRTGLGVTHVPYKGVAPVIQDLAGGHVDCAFLPLAGLQTHLDSRQIVPVGICAPARAMRFPTVPTMNELLHASDFTYESWSGLFVPKAAPEFFASLCNIAVMAALGNPAFGASMMSLGVSMASKMSLVEADAFFRRAIGVANTLMPSRGTAGLRG